jgi:hypothetical protein
MTHKLALDDWVYKTGAGYEGPGRIVCAFKNWMGQRRYVVEHAIANGKGFFYHIYGDKELTWMHEGPTPSPSDSERRHDQTSSHGENHSIPSPPATASTSPLPSPPPLVEPDPSSSTPRKRKPTDDG